MKTHFFSRTRGILLALMWAGGVIYAPAVPYVIQKGGIKTDGIAIVMNKDRSVTLTTSQGGTITFTKDQYADIHADKPASYTSAERMLAQGKYDEAIKVFAGIVRNYYGLEWDNIANMQIARAQAGKKDYAGAIARFEAVFNKAPELKKQSAALWAYHAALLQSKQYDKLIPILKQTIAEGSHADVLRAQMMRGDIEAARGDLEKALMDYLRTVTFAKTGQEGAPKNIMPQAMLKTAQTLEKMKDGRAKEWYRKVVQEYPQSPEAAFARKKI